MAPWKSPFVLALFALAAGCGSHEAAPPLPSGQTAPSAALEGAAPGGAADWLDQGVNAAHVGYNALETTLDVATSEV